jgi:hypothetical protein
MTIIQKKKANGEKLDHVKAWEHAKANPNYRVRPDYTTEDACDRLLDKWMLEMRWQIFRHGVWWEGELHEVNTGGTEPIFTLKVSADPEDCRCNTHIEAPYDHFMPSEIATERNKTR